MADPVAVTVKPEGRSLDHTPSGADVPAGGVVPVGTLVGSAPTLIEDGVLGALDLDGVVEVPKSTSEAVATAGVDLFWDTSLSQATATAAAGRKYLGKSFAAAATAASTVQVIRYPAPPKGVAIYETGAGALTLTASGNTLVGYLMAL
jgi:predicted RecA/RadA family phage recombinase